MYSLDTLSEIHFELSSHCNSKCPQCPRYDMEGFVQKSLNITHLELDIIKDLPIEKMLSLKKVSFCGNFGDPLMHPELDKIIDFFKNQHIEISTNASLRNQEWWYKLGQNKKIRVHFCIDGIGKEHEYYRRNTSYDKIIQNAMAYIHSGGDAHWQFIVFKHNEHQIDQAKKLSKTLGFKKIYFEYSDRFDTSDVWKVYDNGNYLYDLKKSTHQNTLRESLRTKEGDKYWKSLYQNKGEISCIWSKNKKLYIHSDGLVYPCCMLGSTQAGKHIEKIMLKKLVNDFKKIDLHHNSLKRILGSDVYTRLLPSSFSGNPFQHPVCIESCNKNTGKEYFNNKVTLDIN